jgi:type VI secretion system secreted protein Hcp
MNRQRTRYAVLSMFVVLVTTGSMVAQGTNTPQGAPATKFGLPVAKPATASPTTPITATPAAPLPSSAPPSAAAGAFIQIEGAKQGQFKGEVTRKGNTQWIPIVVIALDVESPRDAGSGLPTGRRMYKPITITKEWGAASPQFQRSLAEHESLKQVVIEFVRTGSQGKEQVYRTVTLTNAFVTRIQKRAASLAGRSDKMEQDKMEQEEIELTYQSIEWNDLRPATFGSVPQ